LRKRNLPFLFSSKYLDKDEVAIKADCHQVDEAKAKKKKPEEEEEEEEDLFID
jgi:hypothetical protein